MTISNLLEQPCNKWNNINKVVTSCQDFVPRLVDDLNKPYEYNLFTRGFGSEVVSQLAYYL